MARGQTAIWGFKLRTLLAWGSTTQKYWHWATLKLILFIQFVLFVLTLAFALASIFVFLSFYYYEQHTRTLNTKRRQTDGPDGTHLLLLGALDVPPLLRHVAEVHLVHGHLDVADGIVLGKAVKVVHRHHQRFPPQLHVGHLEGG